MASEKAKVPVLVMGEPVTAELSTVPSPVAATDVTVPVVVDSVPLVGKVTFVVPVIVNVELNAPLVVRFPPSVMVLVLLLTPVPPLAPSKGVFRLRTPFTIFSPVDDHSTVFVPLIERSTRPGLLV